MSFMKKLELKTSLVVQWLGIHLPMQGTGVQSLVQEDPTCRGATKVLRHSKKSDHNEESRHCNYIVAPTATRERPRAATRTRCNHKQRNAAATI